MGGKEWGVDDPEETYWFNTKTGKVERGPQSLAVDRIGPFPTAEEAARAYEIVAAKAKAWRDEEEDEDDF